MTTTQHTGTSRQLAMELLYLQAGRLDYDAENLIVELSEHDCPGCTDCLEKRLRASVLAATRDGHVRKARALLDQLVTA